MQLIKTLSAAALLALAQGAYAQTAPASCTPAGSGATVADVTFEGQAADACQIVTGNPQTGTTGNPGLFTDLGTGWVLVSKVAADGTVTDSSGYTTTWSQLSGTSGTWSFVSTNGTQSLDILFAMHAANVAGGFLFDDVVVDGMADGSSTWTIKWTNTGGQIPNYSNLTLFTRPGAGTVVPQQPVPEPATYAMLALGLGFAGFAARRRAR